MPYRYEWKDNYFVTKFSGELNLKEIRECDNIHDGHVNFDNLRYSIWDFSEIDSVNLIEHDINIISAIDHASSISNPNLKILLIINNPDFKPLADMYIDSVKDLPWEVHIFETYDQALKWKAYN